MRQVSDPENDDGEWTVVDESNDADAAHAFLVLKDYDPRDYDPLRSFNLLVRNDPDDGARKVSVQPVPARWKIAGRVGSVDYR